MSASLPPQPPGGGGGFGAPPSLTSSSGPSTPSASGTMTPATTPSTSTSTSTPTGAAAGAAGGAGAPGTTPTGRKRKNAALFPIVGKKKHKLPRILDSITARNQLPDAPTAGAGRGSGQKGMIKGPYKKRQKKDKDGNPIPNPDDNIRRDGGGIGGSAALGSGIGSSTTSSSSAFMATSSSAAGGGGMDGARRADDGGNDSDAEIKKSVGEGGEGGEGGAATGENKGEDEDDDQEEEPEYSEFEWLQEANQRGRSKEELKALLDCFSPEQLQRYEVYRRSTLSRPTIKKLVATILNQQVSQTMAFVVAGFCKVYVGEMVEKAKEVMDEWGHIGPIRPEHLREAQRRYKADEASRGNGVKASGGYQRRLFCR
ncbi:transcription initiation factor TFIID subunit 11 [Actinomortierella ambigua]|nr:transcription initiation factor TFIID subunit 11 [Actinomortierella ambigua]